MTHLVCQITEDLSQQLTWTIEHSVTAEKVFIFLKAILWPFDTDINGECLTPSKLGFYYLAGLYAHFQDRYRCVSDLISRNVKASQTSFQRWETTHLAQRKSKLEWAIKLTNADYLESH